MADLDLFIGTTIEVTQNGHGFVAGDVVYRTSGGAYALADATAVATSKVVGIVAEGSGNDFKLALPGHKINGLSGFTDGDVLYLSDVTVGAMQTAIPLSPNLAVPVAIAVSSTSIIVCNILGHLVFDPLTQGRPDHQGGDLTFHYFGAYDTGEARSERVDGGALKAWLAGEFDALGAAAAAETAAKAYSDGLVIGLFDDRGNWDASGNLWPATGGSGTAGAILKGDVWRVSVAGTLGGEVADVGDSFRALADTPGQTASNWALFAANTQQATESIRGTSAIATQAEAEDSASTNDTDAVTPKKWWQAFVAGLTTTRLGSIINGATGKTIPVDADELGLVDSAASNVLKKLTWANLKATLKTYFDGLYAPLITLVTESATSRTLGLSDVNTIISCTNSGAVTITVAPQSSVTWVDSPPIMVVQKGTGQVTIAPGSGVTLRTSRSLATYAQYSIITIKRLASDEWLVFGDTE